MILIVFRTALYCWCARVFPSFVLSKLGYPFGSLYCTSSLCVVTALHLSFRLNLVPLNPESLWHLKHFKVWFLFKKKKKKKYAKNLCLFLNLYNFKIHLFMNFYPGFPLHCNKRKKIFYFSCLYNYTTKIKPEPRHTIRHSHR